MTTEETKQVFLDALSPLADALASIQMENSSTNSALKQEIATLSGASKSQQSALDSVAEIVGELRQTSATKTYASDIEVRLIQLQKAVRTNIDSIRAISETLSLLSTQIQNVATTLEGMQEGEPEVPVDPPAEEPPVVVDPVPTDPTPEVPSPEPVEEELPAFGLNLGGIGNNPWLSVINGIGNDKEGTHYVSTKEVHIKCFADKVPEGKQWLARVPVAGERLSEKSFDPLHTRYVNEIVALMDLIHSYRGKVVIDVHNYFRWWKKVDAPIEGRVNRTHNDHLANGTAVWTVIGEPDCPMSVEGFADFWVKIMESPIGKHPAFLVAGLVNEPHNHTADGVNVDEKWPLAVPKLIDAIRSVNTVCWISVAGNFYSSAKGWNTKTAARMANITDPSDKLLFEAHQYMDKKGDGGGRWTSLTDPVVATQGTQDWAAYVKWLKDNNRRGYCGEVGGPATAGDYLTAARKLCDELFIPNRIPCTFWMGGTGQSDVYANGMNNKDGTLKPNAAPLIERIGMMYKGYGPKL